ncbi:MAG: hypothetical protein BZY75_05195 [SAR202 cluster bacterium Io17-Chloro-G7]|nr:MAG: hypothetical protein BZY75_05195 [SAR202 cluster bacterium Io17-Chloro-G7]
MGRRNLSDYQVFKQEGVEYLVMPDLAKHTRTIDVDLKSFLFLKNLSATLELSDGLVLGRRGVMA